MATSTSPTVTPQVAVCPLCGTGMDQGWRDAIPFYICRAAACGHALPAHQARLTELRELATGGTTCRYCAQPMCATLMVDGSVRCGCSRCGRQNPGQAAFLAAVEAERRQRHDQLAAPEVP